jgi:hypothetical protein
MQSNRLSVFIVALLLTSAGRLQAQVAGSGTPNTIPIWTAPTTLGDSSIVQNGVAVGIGTTTPTAAVHVSAVTDLFGFGSTDVQLDNTSPGGISWSISSVGNLTDRVGNFEIKRPSVSIPFSITPFGNVGIGTTTPTAAVHVSAVTDLFGFGSTDVQLDNTSPGGTSWSISSVGNLTDRVGNFEIKRPFVSVPFSITPSGNVGLGTTTPVNPLEMASGAHVTLGGVWTNASSRELKENIRPLVVEEALQALMDLQPMRFNYKAEKEQEYVGFIAEDVPQLVASKDRKSLSPMDIVAVLTKVVQEQQEEIQAQKERIEQLEAKVPDLR